MVEEKPTDILSLSTLELDASGDCPLTAMQAAAIILTLKEISSEQTKIKLKLSELELATANQRLDNARKEGYNQGAGFWFKAGAAAMVAMIGGTLIVIVGVLMGKVDLIQVFKGIS
jgi:hypothetical protein